MSSPHRRGGGFTVEVQHFEVFAEYLSGGLEAQAFARGMVICGHKVVELAWAEGCQVGLAGQASAHATDRVLDATFLPRGVRIAKVGSHAKLARQLIVVCELGAVVDG